MNSPESALPAKVPETAPVRPERSKPRPWKVPPKVEAPPEKQCYGDERKVAPDPFPHHD